MARMTRTEFGSVLMGALERMKTRPQTEEEIEKEVQAECLKVRHCFAVSESDMFAAQAKALG
eukprot:306327-Rhodomonas_salina.1